MQSSDIVIISAARTPFDKFGGVLRDVPSYQLGAAVVREVIDRAGIPDQAVDEVNVGICLQIEAAQDTNIIGRQIVLESLSQDVLSITIDRACCSATTAVQYTNMSLRLGQSQVAVVCGVENMSRASFMTSPKARWEGGRMGDMVLRDPLFRLGYPRFSPLAVCAGEVALEYGVTREEQDDWAYLSQHRYGEALAAGKFANEIFPVSFTVGNKTVSLDADAQPKPDITRDQLSKLATVYSSPTVTAGNAPGMNTGATGLIMTTREKAAELGVTPLATLINAVSVAGDPREIAVMPAPAILKSLKSAGLKLDDIKLFEINEAFAAMPLVSSKILSESNGISLTELRERINVNGGAIAVGHPVGATGCRLIMTMIYELQRRGGGYGMASICGGLAQGDAVLIRVD